MLSVKELIKLRSKNKLEKRIEDYNEEVKNIVILRKTFYSILEKDVFNAYIKGEERVVLAECRKLFKTPKTVMKDIVGVLGYSKSKTLLNQYIAELGYMSIFEVGTTNYKSGFEIYLKFI